LRRAVELTAETGVPVRPTEVLRAGIALGLPLVTAAAVGTTSPRAEVVSDVDDSDAA
jgi:hypothetical protein